jgi:DNA gyrase subunit A
MLITTKGQMVRTRVKEIRETGRNAQGVKLMDLRGSEKLQAIAPVVSQETEEEVESPVL